MRIRLGPAGSPAGSTLEGISKIKELGLQAMEVEFVRGVKMSNALAKECGQVAEQLDIELSVHAPYYINLASDEHAKIEASKARILQSCERGHHLGAKNIVFHPAYFGSREKDEVFDTALKEIKDMQHAIKKNGWNVQLAPETTGKHSALGSLDETIELVKKTGCSLCVDFAHLYARNNGNINYREIFGKLSSLRRRHLHAHFSNIAYTSKGEKNHLDLDHKPDFRPLAEALLNINIGATIICESPSTWKDALKMKKIFEALGYKFDK